MWKGPPEGLFQQEMPDTEKLWAMNRVLEQDSEDA